MHDRSALFEFLGIGELAETTTQLLSLSLQFSTQASRGESSRMDAVGRLVLQQAQEYLSKVREGCVLSTRSGQLSDRKELEFLIDRVLTDWQTLSRELGLDDEDAPQKDASRADQQVEQVRDQLLAFGMAVVALGYMPRLPAKEITFPHSYNDPPTYADIPVPRSPGELLWRIEELEQTVWQMKANDPQELVQHRYGQIRRTYGFFEASASLSRREAKRFGAKKRAKEISFF